MDLNLDWNTSHILDSPKTFIAAFEMSKGEKDLVLEVRNQIRSIIAGENSKLIVITGPCSLHDRKSALEYAKKIKILQGRFPNLLLVMRAYFEKPRTLLGWKGLVYDPDIDGSYKLTEGLRIAREILLSIVREGITPATEFLDTILPQYYSDLIVWGAIGARTVESQLHRQLASGLSCPMGFKNSSSGNYDVAVDAAIASQSPHAFPGINEEGHACLIKTNGNPSTHVVLRGSYLNGPNYQNFANVFEKSHKRGLKSKVMIDCSHGNSQKDHQRQADVVDYLSQKIEESGTGQICGVMLESHLFAGSQKISKRLKYGVSITDSCINIQTTIKLLEKLNNSVQIFRNKSSRQKFAIINELS